MDITSYVNLLVQPLTPEYRLTVPPQVSCLAAITPLIYAWQAQNTAGDTKKKCTSAVVFIGMCTGNVIGPLLYDESQAPLYRSGLISNLIMFALVGGISA